MILARLRDETRDLHERVERRMELLDAGLTLARYRATLAALHGLHAPLERRLARVRGLDACGLTSGVPRRAPMLAADLRALGAPPSVLARECAHAPTPHDVADALGTLYVLEGSMLGGREIARHVVRVLPVSAHDGCTFFRDDAAEVGARWRAFRRAASRWADGRDAGAADAVVAAARRTFLAFDAAMATLD